MCGLIMWPKLHEQIIFSGEVEPQTKLEVAHLQFGQQVASISQVSMPAAQYQQALGIMFCSASSYSCRVAEMHYMDFWMV